MTNQIVIHVGIDWANKEHVFHLLASNAKPVTGSFKQHPQAIGDLVSDWRTRFPGATFFIAIETTKGPLINALLNHHDLVIYPINPAALANYRKAFAHGGGKNDPSDARLLAEYLHLYSDQLRPLRSDDPITRELAALTEDRRRLVDQRTAACNELKAVLTRYFPVIFYLKAAKIYSDLVLHLILNYPTLSDAQRAGKTRLRKLFFGLGTKAKIEERIDLILSAKPLTEDPVTLRIESRLAVALCELIHTYNQQIDIYDKAIKALVVQHTDYGLYKSLPAGS